MSRNSYNFWERALHHVALASTAIAEASFDIERALHRPTDNGVARRPHVFVTGLARAGTTILMRLLHRTGAYRSLTYRDMPFVLAPNLWNRASRLSRKDRGAEERAHGDGILVDFDSPEALEEVFWRVRFGSHYIREDRLIPMPADSDVENDFRTYVSLVLRQHPGKGYLSKNNNNILRLPSLVRCFPDAAVVIPFREPLQHAYSLLRLHHNFLERFGDDRFSRQYMRWLVHHEAGPDHRPFVFDEEGLGGVAQRSGSTDELCYWMRLWIDVYGFIVAAAPEHCLLLSYDRLCTRTETVWPALCERLSLPLQPPAEPLRQSHQAIDDKVPDALLQRAHALHEVLLERAI